MKISELKPNEEFYFLNPSLPGGINNLTRFRRTPKGYTNLVTGENTRLSSPYASSSEVVKAFSPVGKGPQEVIGYGIPMP